MSDYDVIVVGAVMLHKLQQCRLWKIVQKSCNFEKANEEMRGGNTHWSGNIANSD